MKPLFVLICVYPIAVIVMTWPLVFQLDTSIIGMLNVDLIDTVALRSFDQPIGFWPFSYSYTNVQPNKVDAYSFLLFRHLGFPLGDNLWWLFMLCGNGYAAHFMGQSIKGSFRDGISCGLFFLLSETILRETTLHHAPQILTMWFPLYFGCVFQWKRTKQRIWLFGMTASFVCCGLSYWYYALFLGVAALGLLRQKTNTAIIATTMTGVLCLLPFLLAVVHTPIADILNPNVSSRSLFFLSLPADKSARIPILLLLFCLFQYRQLVEKRLAFWCMGIATVCMLFSLNGNLSETFPLIANAQEHIPLLSRLHWPERWSILLHVGAAILVAQASWRWILAIALEQFILSANLPIPNTPTTSLTCLRQLTQIHGPVLMLPMKTSVNLAGMYHRIHNNPVPNPFVLPPQHKPPEEWLHSPLASLEVPTSEQVQSLGVKAVFVDKTPWTQLSQGQINTLHYQITKELGEAQDIGCAYVWSEEKIPAQETEYTIISPPETHIYSFDNFWIHRP